MKTVIAGIAGGTVVAIAIFSVFILMPQEIEFAQEFVTESSEHPCQKLAIDNFELYKKNANLIQNPSITKEQLMQWAEEFEKKEQQLKADVIVHDCMDAKAAASGVFVPKGDWYTFEFEKELQQMLDGGF